MSLLGRIRGWIYARRARRNAKKICDILDQYRENGNLKTPGLSESEDHYMNPDSYNFDPDAAAHDPESGGA